MHPFLNSTEVVDNGPELQARLDRDGYLFIRGLLPAKLLENLRMQLLKIARDAGWVKLNESLEDGIADLQGFCVEPEPSYMEVYRSMYKLPAFHALQHHPDLIQFFQRLLGETVLPHPRTIGRTIFPQREAYTTPPHQDFIPIQGTADTYTAWIPLGDVPAELGGLQIASGSHNRGVYEFRPALGAGGLAVVDPLDGTWVNSSFRQTDVLIFHSMVVHKGMPNQSRYLRLSMDFRYQKVSESIAPGSLEPHNHLINWEEVYADWPSNELKYYWNKWDLKIKSYDNIYHEKRDQMAFELAASGDLAACSALQRIVARDSDLEKRKKAKELLSRLERN